MQTEIFQMSVEAVGTDDGRNTYEIRRKWGDRGKKSLVVELYPTLSPAMCGKMDLSTMHLLNHAEELGWSEIRIVNLYSRVFAGKPTASQLEEDAENLSYIETILEEEDIGEYDLVIAWGNTLLNHQNTIHAKIDLLSMMKEKGLVNQVKYIITDNLDSYGVHPLYLGLRYASDKWKLGEYPVEKMLKELESGGNKAEKGEDKTAGEKPNSRKMEKKSLNHGKEVKHLSDKTKKGAKENVPENQE